MPVTRVKSTERICLHLDVCRPILMRIRGGIRAALVGDLQSGVARKRGAFSLIIKWRLNSANDNPNIIFSACSWPPLWVPNTTRSRRNPNHCSYLLDLKSSAYKFILNQCKKMLVYPANNPWIICLLLRNGRQKNQFIFS